MVSPQRRTRGGFTLIEILIVISIIALLSSLTIASIRSSRIRANELAATIELRSIETALSRYLDDEGAYPAADRPLDAHRNDFPELYRALLGVRHPHGPGGRSSPYLDEEERRVVVRDARSGEIRRATRAEREDDRVDKLLADPWDVPYVYRLRPCRQAGGARLVAEIYSLGQNGVDDTLAGREEEGDDVRP